MDRIEPIRPSLPPIDTTRVRRVRDERQRQDPRQQDRRQEQRRHDAPEGERREWSTDEELQQDDDQDGPPRIDVRA